MVSLRMILISNIGTRDVQYKGQIIEKTQIREFGKKILDNYEIEKKFLSFPIIKPFLDSFSTKLKGIYIFTTNQPPGDKNRVSDTLFFGQIIEKWIEESYSIPIERFESKINPTDYEQIYTDFTPFFTQDGNIFKRAEKRIISLSGGTPQMNGALYVIISSFFPRNNEFYNVVNGELVPIKHENTINKVFLRNASIELLKIHDYQSIIRILDQYNVQQYNIKNYETLLGLLTCAHSRKNFDFKRADEAIRKVLTLIPSSDHYRFEDWLVGDIVKNPKDLIKELYWKIEVCYINDDYLALIALLFRLEESILLQTLYYFFQEDLLNYYDADWCKEGDKSLEKENFKESHPMIYSSFCQFLKNDSFIHMDTHFCLSYYLQNKEQELWNKLQNIKFKTLPLNVNPKILDRPTEYYIVVLKKNSIRSKDIWKIGRFLDLLDKINKYCYDYKNTDRREKDYGHKTSQKNLGTLRNTSLYGHGFKPVTKEIIEELYGNPIEELMRELKQDLIFFLSKILDTDQNEINLENIFHFINTVIKQYILAI